MLIGACRMSEFYMIVVDVAMFNILKIIMKILTNYLTKCIPNEYLKPGEVEHFNTNAVLGATII
jgi:hypothetical protein